MASVESNAINIRYKKSWLDNSVTKTSGNIESTTAACKEET